MRGGGRGGRSRPSREERRAERAAIDDPAVVLAAAARFLEARPRSVTETRRHLVRAGYPAGLVDGAIARLADLGILDDEAFARAWVASRDRAHPRGERALRSELGQKGIDRAVVDEVLAERAAGGAGSGGPGGPTFTGQHRGDEAGGPRDDEAQDPAADEPPDDVAAARLLERRRSALERVEDPRIRRQRAYALLARNGFDPDTAARIAARFDDGPPAD